MASGLGSRNMAMVSRFPKTLIVAADNVLLQNKGDGRSLPEKLSFLHCSQCRYQIHKGF